MDTPRKKVKQPDINQVLADITSALVGHFKMSVVLDRVVETTMRTLHAEVCSIFLEDKQNQPGILHMRAGSGFAKKLVGHNVQYKIGEGFTGAIAQSGRKFTIRSRDELEKLEVDGNRVWIGKHDNQQWPSGQSEFRNCIALALTIKDLVLGVIKVENKDLAFGEFFSEDDEKYFETLANVVALAIENARLHEQIESQLKTIVGKAAHRMRNQLTNYDGIELELLKQVHTSGSADKDSLRLLATRIRDTTDNLKTTSDEFRSYGKPLKIYKKQCNINEIVDNEIWLAQPPGEISIEPHLDHDIPPIELDAGRFAEAMKELLRNSMKAVRMRPRQSTPGQIGVATKLIKNAIPAVGGHQVLVEVWDNGPGFPANFPIFEPFKSTDRQSTGLGLATVKELVEAHDGQIEALQSSSGGALLRITLPLSP